LLNENFADKPEDPLEPNLKKANTETYEEAIQRITARVPLLQEMRDLLGYQHMDFLDVIGRLAINADAYFCDWPADHDLTLYRRHLCDAITTLLAQVCKNIGYLKEKTIIEALAYAINRFRFCLTDCSGWSFEFMGHRHEALLFEEHFTQTSYQCALFKQLLRD
jgi:hypothetical protein